MTEPRISMPNTPAPSGAPAIDPATLQRALELLAASTPAAAALAPAPYALPAAAPAPAPTAWGALAAVRPAAPPPPAPIGVALPIRIELPDGSSVKPLLLFGPECATAEVVRPLIEALLAANVPLDAWKPKPQDGRGGRGGRW